MDMQNKQYKKQVNKQAAVLLPGIYLYNIRYIAERAWLNGLRSDW